MNGYRIAHGFLWSVGLVLGTVVFLSVMCLVALLFALLAMSVWDSASWEGALILAYGAALVCCGWGLSAAFGLYEWLGRKAAEQEFPPKVAMAMLPNDHHPGPRCSCRDCVKGHES